MGLMENINYYYYDLSDPRIRDFFTMDSIWYPIVITLIYCIVIFKLAPDYMKNRPAYKLSTFIKLYNIFQVITNAYIVINMSACYSFSRFFECRPVVYDTDTCGMKIVKVAYVTLLLKIIDLSETVVYILRKKNNQVSFLHVYHHMSTYLIGLNFAKYVISEISLSVPILNCSVHVIMYFYYFLSNFDGPIKEIIKPFKRYLTLIQMGQFIILLAQAIIVMVQNCGYPRVVIIAVILNAIINYWLFFRFYQKTYLRKKHI
ncbi:elongation of very long chain fatty acids protein 4-like [Leptopilina boulardi]|uniref:elongation of very long chain fatty acids protein 4-like n=1 Tax=Leptopilina boulardi TaxID=63433 RepID=UPI0021F529B4|nr:elongation of very long chain fatty acids protein 4-like [Leptopilina boulardi]XP_051161075.1 elongation of very long chain fatty acids protein 4-like [Leptopilina boulardi]